MPVISRSTSSVVLDSGETASVFVENLPQAVQPITLSISEGSRVGLFRASRDRFVGDEINQVGWGVGTRLLLLTVTSQGVPTQVFTPVIALLPDVDKGGQPARGVFLESIVDPVIVFNNIQKKVSLFYYVNAWSPPPFLALPEPPLPPSPPPPPVPPPPSPPPPPPELVIESDSTPFGQYAAPLTLFSGVIPPLPNQVDSNYYENPSYQGRQPFEGEYTGIRDVPNWYTVETAPDLDDIPGSVYESVGPFDMTRFWIAPFTDAHLYRFPESLDGFSAPAKQPVEVPSAPPGPPLPTLPPLPPSPPPADPSQDLLPLFPFMTIPETNTTQEVLAVLFKVQNEEPLTDLEYQTYDCYRYSLARITGLTRCTRVLMRAEGQFYNLELKQDGEATTTTTTPAPFLCHHLQCLHHLRPQDQLQLQRQRRRLTSTPSTSWLTILNR